MCELGIFKKNKLANWVRSGNFARNEGKEPPAIYKSGTFYPLIWILKSKTMEIPYGIC
jgi:hypothetical protein